MTSTRLTRSGRCRFVIGVVGLFLMFGFVAIFHSSQQQLDESQQQLVRCEQQQESLNSRLQSIVEQKFHLEKNLESERKESLEIRQELEQKAKEINDKQYKSNMESNLKFDRLQQNFKLLQSEHKDLVTECSNSKKQQSEQINDLNKITQSLRSELQKEKTLRANAAAEQTEKYNALIHEKERLENDLKSAEFKTQKDRIDYLESIISEYKMKCGYISLSTFKKNSSEIQSLKPLHTSEASKVNIQKQSLGKPLTDKSFVEQMLLGSTVNNLLPPTEASVTMQIVPDFLSSDRLLQRNIPKLNASAPTFSINNKNLIINSVENFQIAPKSGKIQNSAEMGNIPSKSSDISKVSPLSSPMKHTTIESIQTFGSVQKSVTANANLTINVSSAGPYNYHEDKNITSTEQRRSLYKQIPLGVAPIPENFDVILKNDQNLKDNNRRVDSGNDDDKDKTNNNANNNRYANVLNELGADPKGGKLHEDSGGHEVKDKDFNDQNLNLPPEEDNFFDTNFIAGNNKEHLDFDSIDKKAEDNEESINGSRNKLLDGDNLNNEVAGDQGKEFPDGLHLEDGNDEDEDEDDYSNPVARQQEGQAIRN